MSWEIPPWVSSRSYALGTPSARSILTNARWWSNIVLAETSAELWAALPQRFSLEDLAENIHPLGIDLEDAESKNQVYNFLGTLHVEGFLVLKHGNNPQPDHRDDRSQSADGKKGNMTSVEVDFSDWLTEKGILPSAFIELTYRCNQKCVHCFNPGAAHCSTERASRETNELTTQEICDLLADLAKMGVYTVTFSGGEASLRGDLLEILQEAKRLGFSFNLFTNGQISRQLLESICSLWPRTLDVSIYSTNPETHDATTGIPGSFVRSVQTLRIVSAAGIRATVKCPLMRHTIAGYKKILDLCDELNALPQFDLHISAGIDGNAASTVHQITDKETLALLMREPRSVMYVGLDAPNAGRRIKPIDGRVCGAGKDSLSIAPDGTVYPCNSLPLPVGNLRSSRIKEIWDNSEVLQKWNSVVLSDFDECGLYAHCSYCNFCPGMAMAEYGKVFSSHKICCLTARVRMEVSGGLKAGLDPLENRASAGKTLFGYDSSTCLPDLDASKVRDRNHNDPRTEPVEDFLCLIDRIHAEGNRNRKGIKPEVGSPEKDNIHRSDLRTDGFFEFGR